MKQKVVYCCEFCNNMEFDNKLDCQEHEASHFGISLDEYLVWKALHRKAVDAGKSCSISSNPNTRASFDEAIQHLVNFESVHKIENMRRPTDFYY